MPPVLPPVVTPPPVAPSPPVAAPPVANPPVDWPAPPLDTDPPVVAIAPLPMPSGAGVPPVAPAPSPLLASSPQPAREANKSPTTTPRRMNSLQKPLPLLPQHRSLDQRCIPQCPSSASRISVSSGCGGQGHSSTLICIRDQAQIWARIWIPWPNWEPPMSPTPLSPAVTRRWLSSTMRSESICASPLRAPGMAEAPQLPLSEEARSARRIHPRPPHPRARGPRSSLRSQEPANQGRS